MNMRISVGGGDGFRSERADVHGQGLSERVNGWIDMIAPAPWGAHMGLHPAHDARSRGARPGGAAKPPLYTPEQRAKRDATAWTLVQGILAPLQFLVFAVSLGLVIRYLTTGKGYEIATASILLKTVLLYTIMVTGSVWEKVVFGKWLFARAFFWEDVFSMGVLALQTAYVTCLVFSLGSARDQMLIAVAAYAIYVVNATQFVLKLREARLEGARARAPRSGLRGANA